jgi:hypothetical protein
VEKMCIVKDGSPWLWEGMNRHLLDPTKDPTRTVMETGKTLGINDIWAASCNRRNPFLDHFLPMDLYCVESIKKPVASSMMIMHIKRGNDVFCTIDLSRYREKPAFESITSQSRHSSVVTAR